jgi:N-acetyl-gamma-glutamyl-phosphate reductase
MKKIFIDGSAGTTGLRIHDRLAARSDIEMLMLSDADRKDSDCRREAINSSDITFLCLPDSAAIEAVALTENKNTVIIDTSTAHRTSPGWAYGYPELSPEFEQAVLSSSRIAVPGCHASGFITLVYPLIERGIISSSAHLTCHSVTGYSGGGKKMIADYEADQRDYLLDAPRQYGIGQTHKHLKEMVSITGLDCPPIFCPIVSDFYSGMVVTVPLFKSELNSGFTVEDIKKAYSEKYTGPIVSYEESIDDSGFISAGMLSGKDSMKVTVSGNDERILLIAAYDNLGKGASGAAVECLNMVMGVDRTTGLEL